MAFARFARDFGLQPIVDGDSTDGDRDFWVNDHPLANRVNAIDPYDTPHHPKIQCAKKLPKPSVLKPNLHAVHPPNCHGPQIVTGSKCGVGGDRFRGAEL